MEELLLPEVGCYSTTHAGVGSYILIAGQVCPRDVPEYQQLYHTFA